MSILYRPKKTLGQHFLTKQGVNLKIVESAEISAWDTVIEIGPGRGSLTDHLAKTGAKIIAVEKDTALVRFLREKYIENKNVEIVEDDILKFSPVLYGFTALQPYSLVGNIPYYLTSHLLRVALTQWPSPKTIVFMVQKEVAKRIVAKPPYMNMLSLLVQLHGTPKIVMDVKRGSFNPPPKVDSAVLKIDLEQYSNTAVEILRLAAKAFSHPRKMIGSSIAKNQLISADIDPKRRPGTLTVEEWKTLWKTVV